MPEPTSAPDSHNPREVNPEDLQFKPRGKSGFNPQEYLQEQINSEEAEVSPIQTMYIKAKSIIEERMWWVANEVANGRYTGDDYKLRKQTKSNKEHNIKFAPPYLKVFLTFHDIEEHTGEPRIIRPISIASLGSDSLSLHSAYIPDPEISKQKGFEPHAMHIVFEIYKDGRPHIALEDEEDEENMAYLENGENVGNKYFLFLGPEMVPVILQDREWDGEHLYFADMQKDFPNHELTDEECVAILEAIAIAPV